MVVARNSFRACLQATFPSPKNGLFSVLGYEPLIFDLDHTRAWSRKKSRLTTPKNWTSKNQGDVEAFKKGYWGGNIEGALKKVDLEKILSQTSEVEYFSKCIFNSYCKISKHY